MKYEYDIVAVKFEGENARVKKLNELGQHGWQLIRVVERFNYEELYLMRELPIAYDYIVETQHWWGITRVDDYDRYVINMGKSGYTLLHTTCQVHDSHNTYSFVWSRPRRNV